MKPLDLQSEKYQPTGSISADGVRNQLGRPRLDRLTLLVRESVQNSWDARKAEEGPVEFGLAGQLLSPSAQRFLLETIFRREADGISLRDELKKGGVSLLTVYDRGTVGLSGPTRADAPVAAGVAPNFVNLLRNVGHPPARVRGGGTYGFGKTALFLASKVRTIVVHTQVRSGRKTEQRFMAAALGSEFSRRSITSQQRFTGRHWWGREGKGGIVEPVVGRDAVAAAKALGLPPFDEDTGTTIAIIAPDLEDRSAEEAMRFLAHALLRNFWPKMVDGPARMGTMRFELSWNGQRVPIPKPQDIPPLNGFVQAFHNLQPQASSKSKSPMGERFVRSIDCLKPIEHLGRLSLTRFPVSPRLSPLVEVTDDKDPFTGPSHHVALLRGPRFVVRYLEGPAVPFDQAEYAGVFLASDSAEPAFSRSEPPTHDDWVPDGLEDRHEKTFVRVALRNIREVLDDFSGARSVSPAQASELPLGDFSDMLGGLIPAVRGTGASTRDISPPGAGSAARPGTVPSGRQTSPSVRLVLGEERLEVLRGVPALIIPFDVQRSAQRAVTVVARVGVVLEEGSLETDPPEGAETPRVLCWTDGRGRTYEGADSITIPSDSAVSWIVAVSVPRDAAVGVELSVAGE